MTDVQQRNAAREFAATWTGHGDEKQETQKFWISLLQNVFGIADATQFINFEETVQLDHISYIDGYIPLTKVLIEQKSMDVNLKKGQHQSDGAYLTPFQQAQRYAGNLPYNKRPRWIVVSNFQEFHIHDMNRPHEAPEVVLLADLEKEYHRLQFLVDTGDENIRKEMEVSLKAGELVGLLYEALLKEYKDPESPKALQSLNALCVRLVFCLYAEDAGIFGKHGMFHHYLQARQSHARGALIDLFKVLDTPEDQRDPYMDKDLAAFPYVNGGLFADETLVIPTLTPEIVDIILNRASADFDWSAISPTIFGALFESTLNPETRRAGGMHYTSIENIHKVIDPLFLNDLRQELVTILNIGVDRTRNQKLRAYQQKLASLTFLDPACGSGNFLTETYLCLRRLENEVIAALENDQISLGIINPILISIGNYYGIEINDFAVAVARTALWIAELQMKLETEAIIHKEIRAFPLENHPTIVEANALRIDWETVVPKDRLNYIMGNPPFVGQARRKKEQAEDMNLIFGKGAVETKQDYVICWYMKAMDYIATATPGSIHIAYVSTNSICQGESVPSFWRKMIDMGAEIQFAHCSFVWDSEASEKAHVHCVIVGFTNTKLTTSKTLFDSGKIITTDHINPYLIAAPDVWLVNRVNKNSKHPKMTTGSPPTDDGGLLLTPEERLYFIKNYPYLEQYIRPFIGAREFLHNIAGEHSRYCFWFEDGIPSDIANNKEIKQRLERVRALRLSSNADRIQKMADYPYLFCQIRQPKTTYLAIPRHSSEKRRYIPIGYITSDVIAGDACSIIPNISLYEFGILTSNVHMAWMRAVCGRLKSDYRYSPSVYNNFPWPEPTELQKEKIKKAAQAILDARAKYSDWNLSDMYEESNMPLELRKAHVANDRAVMEAYGFDVKTTTEASCVAELMRMYQKLTEQ